ncbi:MAG: molybdenum cofactor guanylyltransferase [Methanobacteriaceae archaeon]|jgi:molybdopterin-guanine dinucleotide biosynthesis protein A|nr:MAG: molybdenum cofactor guanylyltransferase [Methanobacterium sp. BRmetb2]MCC7558132.1 molybdenum cofactor guanylyltransferase [Methanobacteriaceae archaeon]
MKSCIILCGGKGIRMGRDKGSLFLDDKPMILHSINNLKDFFDEILIVLRDKKQIDVYKKIVKKKEYQQTSILFLNDKIPDQGPLAGIMTGLSKIKSDHALILPCDSPFVSESFIKNIFYYFEKENSYQKTNKYDGIIPQWDDGKIEPLHSIYKKKAVPKIEKLLKNGVNDVKSLTQCLKMKYINVKYLDESKDSFKNINRPEDITSL